MFLGTTALSEFWRAEEKILFLGSWCLPYARRGERSGVEYEVMPSPWDDRKRFYEATQYLDEYSEWLLGRLGDHLNAMHGVAHGSRYWRILVGPWLLQYLHVLYDRYVHLAAAFERDGALETIVLDPRCFTVPHTTAEFTQAVMGDLYNLQIFSQLLREMGHAFPSRAVPETRDARVSTDAHGAGRGGWVRAARRLAGRGYDVVEEAMRRARGRQWHVGLCDVYCSKPMLWSLAWRSRFHVLRLRFRGIEAASSTARDALFDERRTGLARLPSRNEFERFAAQLLPKNFPTIYLEGYRSATEESLRGQPRSLRVLVSATGWYENEAFKFSAAEASERGARLVTLQHGGGYGVSRAVPIERHEARVADSFMVWGWADAAKEAGPWKNLPSPRLSSSSARRSPVRDWRKAKTVLMVATADFRYLHWFQSIAIGRQCDDYLAWQLRFLSAMPDSLRAAIVYRPYMRDFGSAFPERIAERFPAIRRDEGLPIEKALRQSRIVVVDYCGTTFLEVLAANVPAVLFWDSGLAELRPEAEPDFDRLRRAGILLDSPEAAATKLEKIYANPWVWWGGERVQEVRRAFVERYARVRRGWVKCWLTALDAELALTGDGRRTREH